MIRPLDTICSVVTYMDIPRDGAQLVGGMLVKNSTGITLSIWITK